MCGLAHYLEDEGLATVVVALVREHAVAMQPPRALWVPFELGRPFGTPNESGFQRHVLSTALALLDECGSGPILKDFIEPVPWSDGDPQWRFPVKLEKGGVTNEASRVDLIWQRALQRNERTTVGVSGLSPGTAVKFIERFYSSEPMSNPKGMALASRARFAIDDIKAFYLEAAVAAGGHPSSKQLQDWFWNETLAGALIVDFQDRARCGDDKNLQLIAGSLVPSERIYQYR